MKRLWEALTILVNNAWRSTQYALLLEEIQEKDWNLVVDVNLKGAFLCCQAVIPEMVKQRGGVIGNIYGSRRPLESLLGGRPIYGSQAGVEG